MGCDIMKITDESEIKIGNKTLKIKDIRLDDIIENTIVKIDNGMIVHPTFRWISGMLKFSLYFGFLFILTFMFIYALDKFIKGKSDQYYLCVIGIALFIIMPYFGFLTFKRSCNAPIFVGDGWFAFPDCDSPINSEGIPYKYGIYTVGNFDIEYRRGKWKLIEDNSMVSVKEEVAKAIFKYVLKNENAFYELKRRPETRYSEIMMKRGD